MSQYKLSLLLVLINIKLLAAQFMAPYGMMGGLGSTGLFSPYMNPFGGLGMGMGMGYDPLLFSGMGMNMFNSPIMANPYASSLGYTNNGNTFGGFGAQKYGSPLYSRSLNGLSRRYVPGFGCMNRSGCGTGFQQKR